LKPRGSHEKKKGGVEKVGLKDHQGKHGEVIT